MFKPPGLLATQVVPTAGHVITTTPRAAVTFTSTHISVRYLPRAVDMLAVRIEQLTAEGLSPSKIRGLAGRSVG